MDILDTVEQRITGARTQQNTAHAQVVEGMREEIGVKHYPEAKRQLPILEQAINTELLPFVGRLRAIAMKAGTPLPTQIQQKLSQMEEHCLNGPKQVRAGIAGYEQLRYENLLWKDGKSIDVMVRASLIAGIRQALKSWDGKLSYLRSEQRQIEDWLKESHWPHMAGPGAMVLPPEPPEPPKPINVLT
jgi:hypothetical protein